MRSFISIYIQNILICELNDDDDDDDEYKPLAIKLHKTDYRACADLTFEIRNQSKIQVYRSAMSWNQID